MAIIIKKNKSSELEKALMTLRDARNMASIYAEAEKNAKAEVEALLAEQQLKKAVYRDGDKKYSVSYVTPEPRVVIDEAGLLEAFDGRTATKFTNRVIDRKKLEEAMDKNPVINEKAQEFMTLKESKPYLRFTEGANDDLEALDGE